MGTGIALELMADIVVLISEEFVVVILGINVAFHDVFIVNSIELFVVAAVVDGG